MKEPVQLIEEIHQMLSDLTARVQVMDNNIKLLQAKVNSEVFSPLIRQVTGKAPDSPKPPTPQITIPPPMLGPPTITAEVPSELAAAYRSTMVQGKYLAEDGKPLHGIPIKILNSDKKIIKETTTNRAGIWMAHLRPGKYMAKMIVDGRPAQYKLFEVIDGQPTLDI